MATNIKVLNTVQISSIVPSASTVVYAPTGSRSALVTSIALFNGSGVTEDVLLGSRNATITAIPAVFSKTAGLVPGASAVVADVASLRASDSESIVGYISNVSGTVNCVVFGIERD